MRIGQSSIKIQNKNLLIQIGPWASMMKKIPVVPGTSHFCRRRADNDRRSSDDLAMWNGLPVSTTFVWLCTNGEADSVSLQSVSECQIHLLQCYSMQLSLRVWSLSFFFLFKFVKRIRRGRLPFSPVIYENSVHYRQHQPYCRDHIRGERPGRR